MQELEKILEEIDETINRYEKNPELITEDITDFCYGLNVAKCIIRRHMKDGWIPAEERLPEPYRSERSEKCPVGGVDRTQGVDRISLQNDVETMFWMAVWAAEPIRPIDVRMSYTDLKIICDLIDRERNRREGERNEID